jgi:hypothetical protein
VSLTYERTSTRTLNGRSPSTPANRYSSVEIVTRTGVPVAVLAIYAGDEQYAAIDVVRFAVVERLVRSGVPVARAAALVQAAETLANTAV